MWLIKCKVANSVCASSNSVAIEYKPLQYQFIPIQYQALIFLNSLDFPHTITLTLLRHHFFGLKDLGKQIFCLHSVICELSINIMMFNI